MTNKEKLEEATIKALQGKLNEDSDINKYYRNFSDKVRQIAQEITHSTETREKRTKNIITLDIEQRYIINRKDCQNYIQQHAKLPLTRRAEYKVKDGKQILNKEFKQAFEYVDNKYIPSLKDYMDSHNKECLKLIQKAFKDNNIIIKDIKDESEIDSLYNEYKDIYVRNIVNDILRDWENPYELYPYQHIYSLIIDINDNENTEVDNGKYRVSYNPNYNEYTVRDKKTGKVYYASTDSDIAYGMLKRLNNGGDRGPAWKPHN